MKIEKKEKEFQPVTITLETQAELDIFRTVFYHVGGDKVAEVFGETSYISRNLDLVGGEIIDSVKGTIYIN
jgi:hypothetical protein